MQLHRVEDDVRDIVDKAVKELGTEKVPSSGTGVCHGAGLVLLRRSHLDEFTDLGVWKCIFKFFLCHWVPWQDTGLLKGKGHTATGWSARCW